MSGKMGNEAAVLRKAIREIELELDINLEAMRNLRSRKACINHLVELIKVEIIKNYNYEKKIRELEEEVIIKHSFIDAVKIKLKQFVKKEHEAEIENEFKFFRLKNLNLFQRVFKYKNFFWE